MVRAVRRKRLQIRIALGIAVIAGAFLSGGAADAIQPNDVIEQHWDLLGTTITTPRTVIEPIKRGSLPGGNSAYDPQPTATLEVGAKITGAVGGGGYSVQVNRSTGQNIASVFFGAADTSLKVKTASLSWPALNTDLDHIRVLKVEPNVGDLAGTIELTKAYFKIRQAGTIAKTVGRAPLAGKQASVLHTDWRDAPGIVLYKHAAADFDPAPTIRFRTTGVDKTTEFQADPMSQDEVQEGLHVRLVDVTAGDAPVTGAEHVHSPRSTITSGPLSLTDGHLYKVQVRVDATTPPAEGEINSAELVLEQATTDPDGIAKTVGWYSSVTTTTDVAQDGARLGFLFRTPNNVLPNAPVATWESTVKQTSATCCVGTKMFNATSGTPASGAAMSSNIDEWKFATDGDVTLPSLSTTDLDTQAVVNTGAAGKVTSSLLRLKLSLRDLTAPTILSGLAASNERFSPVLAVGNPKRTTTFTARVKDFSPVDWTIAVKDSAGATVASGAGSGLDARTGANVSWTWDGRDSVGVVVPDGTYSATLSAVDVQGNASVSPPSPLQVIIDTVAPTITGYAASPSPFSPNGDGYLDTTTLSASFSETGSWSLQISSGCCTGPVVSGSGTSMTYTWDGLGAGVSDGTYTGTLSVVDGAGNPATGTTSAVRDVTAPSIAALAASNPSFSPNADGTKDTTTISATLNDSWTPIAWTLNIKSDTTIHRTISGSGPVVSELWDGTDSGGTQVPDGTYSAELTANDAGRNVATSSVPVRVDTVAPDIAQHLPEGYGNTIYLSQRLGAKVTDDDGSGVAPDSASMTFNGSQTFNGASLSFDTSSGWFTTPQLILAVGQEYNASISVSDEAGNSLNRTWPFRAIQEPVAEATFASLFGVGNDVGAGGSPATRLWEFTPRINIDERRVQLPQGSKHPGFGTIASSVPLSAAQLKVTTAGTTTVWPTAPYSASEVKTVYHQLSYVDPNGTAIAARVPGGSYELPNLRVELPATVEAATVEMSDVSTSALSVAVCEDPSRNANCTPDPLRVFISQDLATKLNNGGRETQNAETTWETERPFLLGFDRLVPDPTNLQSGAWRPVQPLQDFPCLPGTPARGPVCLVNGVYYPYGSQFVPPDATETFCEAIRFCTYYRANSANDLDRYGNHMKYYCIRGSDGRDQEPRTVPDGRSWGSANPYCVQGKGITTWQPYTMSGKSSGDKIHLFQTYWASDWGYNDGTYDELGVHWATRAKDTLFDYPRAADKPSWLSGSWDELNYEPGIYPETAPDEPTATAYDTWTNCFAIPNKGKVDAEIRKRDQVDGTIHQGSGAGPATGSVGFRQWQSCTSGSNTAYLRTEYANLYAFVVQTRNCGSPCGNRKDGFLKGTWGHTYRSMDYGDFVWQFLKNAALACASGPPPASCVNPFGLLFSTADGASQATKEKAEITEVDNPNAFTYK